jgi:hypothetical protein
MSALEGVEVKVGRSVYVVPPISVWAQEQLEQPVPEDITARQGMDRMLDQVLLLLEPNYPALTRDELKKQIRLKDLSAVVQAVVRAAGDGLVAASPGEAVRP